MKIAPCMKQNVVNFSHFLLLFYEKFRLKIDLAAAGEWAVQSLFTKAKFIHIHCILFRSLYSQRHLAFVTLYNYYCTHNLHCATWLSSLLFLSYFLSLSLSVE